jgi:hypothetical protein
MTTGYLFVFLSEGRSSREGGSTSSGDGAWEGVSSDWGSRRDVAEGVEAAAAAAVSAAAAAAAVKLVGAVSSAVSVSSAAVAAAAADVSAHYNSVHGVHLNSGGLHLPKLHRYREEWGDGDGDDGGGSGGGDSGGGDDGVGGVGGGDGVGGVGEWGKDELGIEGGGGSFKAKFMSRKYVDGGHDEYDEHKFKTGEQWCMQQDFNPRFGFADEGWGFAGGTVAVNLLDFERLHLEAVSIRNRLPTVFISIREDAPHHAEQVVCPCWYPYKGIMAPLGTFVFSRQQKRLGRAVHMHCSCCVVA